MDPFLTLVGVLVVLLIISCILAAVYSSDQIRKNPFLDRHLLQKGMDRPVIWIYYDHSEVNARQWSDFGARSDRALNIPFLNLCYQSIVHHHSDSYRIEVIGGLAGAADWLGGWDQLPPGLRDPLSPVNEAELNYLRAAILARYGGLWLSAPTVCLKSFGVLPRDKTVFFGTDLDEMYAGPQGTVIPGFRAIWCPVPQHPMFVEWAAVTYARIASARGGSQIRGDEKWDFTRFTTQYVHTGIMVDPSAEGMRKKDGKRLQLEDLLASGTGAPACSTAVFVSFPWKELLDRRMFGWFLRMSEENIMSSDLAVSHMLRASLAPLALPLPLALPVAPLALPVAPLALA
jgi:hypothetical protein